MLKPVCMAVMGLFLVSCYKSVAPNPPDGGPDAAEPDGRDGFEDPVVEDFGFEDMDFYETDPVPDMTEEIIEPDAGPDLDPGTCLLTDLVPQTLCGPGFKCTIGEATSCVPQAVCEIAGPFTANEGCRWISEGDDCSAGHYCLDEVVESRCRKFCRYDAHCDGRNAGCLITIPYPGCPNGLREVLLCSFNCDYFYQTGCERGQACRVLIPAAAFQVYSDCTASGPGIQGASCPNGSTDCAAGYDCFEVDDGSMVLRLCLKLCNYSGGYPVCEYGYTCSRGTDWPAPLGACL